MEWSLAGPLLAGLAATGLARRFPAKALAFRALGAGLGLFLCIWGSNTFPAMPPRVQTDFLAWAAVGMLLPRWTQGPWVLLLAWGMLPQPDGVGMGLTALAAALARPLTPDWRSRLGVLGSALVGAWALFAGSSARLALISLGWGLAAATAGGGSAWPLAVLALIGHAFASLPNPLFFAMLVLAATDLRQPAGWLAAAWVMGTARVEPI